MLYRNLARPKCASGIWPATRGIILRSCIVKLVCEIARGLKTMCARTLRFRIRPEDAAEHEHDHLLVSSLIRERRAIGGALLVESRETR